MNEQLNTTAYAISAEEWHTILAWATNPFSPSSPTFRLSKTILDDVLAADLVTGWIYRETQKAAERGDTINPRLFKRICRRVSLEALLHQEFGLPVNQIRAASLYNKRRATLFVLDGKKMTAEQQAECWNTAVREHMVKQQEKFKRGEIHSLRWLPLADGTSSNPTSTKPANPHLGLEAWNRFISTRRNTTDFYNHTEINSTDNESFAVSAYSVAHYGELEEPVDINAQWLAEHGITSAMIAQLSDEQLEDMGLDSQLLRSQAATL